MHPPSGDSNLALHLLIVQLHLLQSGSQPIQLILHFFHLQAKFALLVCSWIALKACKMPCSQLALWRSHEALVGSEGKVEAIFVHGQNCVELSAYLISKIAAEHQAKQLIWRHCRAHELRQYA